MSLFCSLLIYSGVNLKMKRVDVAGYAAQKQGEFYGLSTLSSFKKNFLRQPIRTK